MNHRIETAALADNDLDLQIEAKLGNAESFLQGVHDVVESFAGNGDELVLSPFERAAAAH